MKATFGFSEKMNNWIKKSLEIEMFENPKKLFDSAQANTAQSLTPPAPQC